MPTGCTRIAAVTFRIVVLIRSVASASATPAAGRRGPWPIRELCRALRIAARRCSGDSPGSMYMIVCRPSDLASICNPVDRER
jgi:hypothetical protein